MTKNSWVAQCLDKIPSCFRDALARPTLLSATWPEFELTPLNLHILRCSLLQIAGSRTIERFNFEYISKLSKVLVAELNLRSELSVLSHDADLPVFSEFTTLFSASAIRFPVRWAACLSGSAARWA